MFEILYDWDKNGTGSVLLRSTLIDCFFFLISCIFRYALVLWIVLTAGWNKARPIGKRTGEVGGLGYWSAMPNKRARGRSATVDQTTGFISDSDLADTGIEPVIYGDIPFPNSAGSVCSPWAFGPRATLVRKPFRFAQGTRRAPQRSRRLTGGATGEV